MIASTAIKNVPILESGQQKTYFFAKSEGFLPVYFLNDL